MKMLSTLNFANLESWIKHQYESYKVQTKVKLINGIAYSQGRQEPGENTVMIETFEDGQNRVTFIYDGSFDFEDGRMEIHKREGSLPGIKDEFSRSIHFKGFDAPLTGVSLLIKKDQAMSPEKSWNDAVTNARDGATSGLITKLSITDSDRINLFQTSSKVPTFQMEIPSVCRFDHKIDVNWRLGPIKEWATDIKTLYLQNQMEGKAVDGFIFERVETEIKRTSSLSAAIGQCVYYTGIGFNSFQLLSPTLFHVIFALATLAIWILTAITFRDQKVSDLGALLLMTALYAGSTIYSSYVH